MNVLGLNESSIQVSMKQKKYLKVLTIPNHGLTLRNEYCHKHLTNCKDGKRVECYILHKVGRIAIGEHTDDM